MSGQDPADTIVGHIDKRRNMKKIRFSQFQATLFGGLQLLSLLLSDVPETGLELPP
jgi:hypothetical protein